MPYGKRNNLFLSLCMSSYSLPESRIIYIRFYTKLAILLPWIKNHNTEFEIRKLMVETFDHLYGNNQVFIDGATNKSDLFWKERCSISTPFCLEWLEFCCVIRKGGWPEYTSLRTSWKSAWLFWNKPKKAKLWSSFWRLQLLPQDQSDKYCQHINTGIIDAGVNYITFKAWII